MDRLSKDPTAPASLRDALEKASGEQAPHEVLNRLLGASALGAGAAAIAVKAGARGPLIASTLVRGSLAAKSMAIVAIFVAGGVVGGYAVHEHDAREAREAPQARAPERVLPPPLTVPDDRESGQAPPVEKAPPRVAPAEVPSVPMAPRARRRSLDMAPPSESRASSSEASPTTTPVASGAPSLAPVTRSWREELAGLRVIRDEAADEHGGDALAAIDAYRRRFPAPVFEQELLFLEAQARSKRGDPAACGVLDHFTTIYPTSLLSPRARALQALARCPPSTR